MMSGGALAAGQPVDGSQSPRGERDIEFYHIPQLMYQHFNVGFQGT